jgi:serine/threonine protein kinase
MAVAEARVAGRYRLGESLGAGGMGRVWLARDEVLHRDVAIKEIALPFGLSDDELDELRRRSLREARAAARLNHRNVVQIYDVIHGDEQPWIVMEHVPSRSLLQVIKENGPLPVDQVAGIGLAVLSALDAANRVGVLHRDVKPSNVLIADDGRVVLTDFGSAILDESEGAITRTGVIVGSPQYIAPERARNGLSTPESDLWSLGATLYEAVEGRPPYTRATALDTLIALATERPDPMRRAGPLKPVLNGLLKKNPDARMSAADVEQRLRRIADVQTSVALRRVPAPRRPVDWSQLSRENLRPSGAMAYLNGAPPDVNGQPTPADDADEAAPAPPSPARPRYDRAPRFVGRRPSRRQWVAAAAVVLIALGTLAVLNSGIPRFTAAKSPQVVMPGTAAAGGPAPAVSPSTATVPVDPDLLPATFTWWYDVSGFRVAVPSGWESLREGPAAMLFCAPGGPPTLRVREWARSDRDLPVALAREETRARLAGYRRLRMEVSPQGSGAEWEYLFDDPKMGRLRGVDRVVVVAGHGYLLQWRVPPEDWQANRARFEVITKSFRPPRPPRFAAV